jgi:hypothetical protein
MANNRTTPNLADHSADNAATSAFVGIVDAIDLGVIFLFKQCFESLLTVGKFILFPFAAAAACIQALLAWRQVYLDGAKDSSNIVRALVETLAALAITTAVVGALAFSTTFALVAPIMFAVTSGAKSLFHLGAAAYYLTKALMTEPLATKDQSLSGKTEYPEERRENFNKAAKNAVSGVIGLGITAAIITVMVLGHVKIAAFVGIPVAAAAATFGFYSLCSVIFGKQKETAPATASAPSAAVVHQTLSAQKAPGLSRSNSQEALLVAAAAPATPASADTRPKQATPTSNSWFSCIGSLFGKRNDGYQALAQSGPDEADRVIEDFVMVRAVK